MTSVYFPAAALARRIPLRGLLVLVALLSSLAPAPTAQADHACSSTPCYHGPPLARCDHVEGGRFAVCDPEGRHPTVLRATSDGEAVTLRWTPPVSDPFLRVEGYEVLRGRWYESGGDSGVVGLTHLSYVDGNGLGVANDPLVSFVDPAAGFEADATLFYYVVALGQEGPLGPGAPVYATKAASGAKPCEPYCDLEALLGRGMLAMPDPSAVPEPARAVYVRAADVAIGVARDADALAGPPVDAAWDRLGGTEACIEASGPGPGPSPPSPACKTSSLVAEPRACEPYCDLSGSSGALLALLPHADIFPSPVAEAYVTAQTVVANTAARGDAVAAPATTFLWQVARDVTGQVDDCAAELAVCTVGPTALLP